MRNLILLALALGGLSAQALNVNVSEPGTLKALVTNPSEASLTVSGTVNAADLYFAGQELRELTALDLGAATVVAYYGDELFGARNYKADRIPAGAFAGSKLQSVVLGPAMKTVGMGAFAGCQELKSVNLNGVVAIDEAAFKGCKKLAEVANTESLVTVGDLAFDGCESLTEFAFGENLETIGEYAFAHTGLHEALLDNSPALSQIGARAFANNKALTHVQFSPAANPALGQGIFFGDSALTTISFPENAAELPAHAMAGASSVEIFVMPNVDSIGEHAMTNMTGLTKIDARALSEVPEVADDVWANVEQDKVELLVEDDEIAELFKNAGQWQDFDIKYDHKTDVVDNIIADAPQLRGRFVGKLLEIEGAPMARVELFDIAGRQLTAVSPAADHLSLDTTPYSANIYLVNVTLSDGTKATLKLARR